MGMPRLKLGLAAGGMMLVATACSGIKDCKEDAAQCAELLNQNAKACAESYQHKVGSKARKHCEEAVRTVGKAKAKAALPGLLEMVKAPETNIPDDRHRSAAVGAISLIGDASAGDALIAAIDLTTGNSSDTKDKAANRSNEAIATALGSLKVKKAVPKLLELIEASKSDYVVLKAVRALGEIGDEAAVDALVEIALHHNNKFMRKNAVEALGNIGSAKAVEALVQMMFIEYQGVSFYREASYALFQVGPACADTLLNTMAMKNEAVNQYFSKHGGIKESAIKAKCGYVLGDLRDERAVEPLLKAFEDAVTNKDPVVLVYASAPLAAVGASTGDKRVGPALAKQAFSLDASLRDPLMRALVQVHYTPAAKEMVEAMSMDHFVSACVKAGNSKEACEASDNKASIQGAQQAAADHATNLAGGDLLPLIQKIIADEKDPKMKAYFTERAKRVEAAKECGSDTACWTKKLSDGNAFVRERAAWEMSWLKDPPLDALAKLLKDKNDKVRSAAIMAYWIRGDKRAIPQIEATLAEEAGSADYIRVNEDLKRLLVHLSRD